MAFPNPQFLGPFRLFQFLTKLFFWTFFKGTKKLQVFFEKLQLGVRPWRSSWGVVCWSLCYRCRDSRLRVWVLGGSTQVFAGTKPWEKQRLTMIYPLDFSGYLTSPWYRWPIEIDGVPIKTSIYRGFSMAMLNNRRVITMKFPWIEYDWVIFSCVVFVNQGLKSIVLTLFDHETQ